MADQQLDHRDHYEALFDKQYLRWFNLQGREVTVEIEKVEKDVELTMRGGIKSKKPVVHFKGKDKPLVLNATNCNSIAHLLGNRPSQWIGKRIVLYPTTTKMFDNDLKTMKTVGCIRIKPATGKGDK